MLTRAITRASLAHRGWRYRTRVDPAEIGWLRRALRPGDLAVDVGAYKGGYTYWMRRVVGPEGAVVACEPQPEPAEYLRRCVRAFAWRNVRVEELALGAAPGEGVLRVPGTRPSPGASLGARSMPPATSAVRVRVGTLDDILLGHPHLPRLRLVKCDVEGAERDVFEGGATVLERHAPLLLFECETRHLPEGGLQTLFGRLRDLGYEGSFFWGGAEVPVARFDAAVHQVEGSRPYANNFAFRRAGAP